MFYAWLIALLALHDCWHPCRGAAVFVRMTGGFATLNPRLMARNPPGSLSAIPRLVAMNRPGSLSAIPKGCQPLAPGRAARPGVRKSANRDPGGVAAGSIQVLGIISNSGLVEYLDHLLAE